MDIELLSEDVFDADVVEDSENNFDPLFEASYIIFKDCFEDQFRNAMKIDKKLFSPVTFKSRTILKYIEKFNSQHQDSLSSRSTIVRELFLLHHTARCMYRFNDEELHLKHVQFRSHFYFPNIIFMLVRFLRETRAFLQKTIRAAYQIMQKNNAKIVHIFENSIYLDTDVIRTDVLNTFLGTR